MSKIVARCLATIMTIMILGVSALAPVTALAYDNDYMSFDKWYSTSEVNKESFNQDTVYGNKNGVFEYIIDSANRCLYIYLDVTDENIIEPTSVKIAFDITDSSENYLFSVDSDGLCDCDSQISKLFQVHQNYQTYSNAGHEGRYICAVEFNNGQDINSVTISFWCNGHRCLIKENLVVQTYVEESTTEVLTATTSKQEKTKIPKTKAAKTSAPSANNKKSKANDKPSRLVSTKFYQPTNAKVNSTAVKKYYKANNAPNGNDSIQSSANFYAQPTDNGSNTQQSLGAGDYTDTQDYIAQTSGSHMTQWSKYLLAIAIFIAIIGLALIIVGLIKKQFAKRLDEEKQKLNKSDTHDPDDFDF